MTLCHSSFTGSKYKVPIIPLSPPEKNILMGTHRSGLPAAAGASVGVGGLLRPLPRTGEGRSRRPASAAAGGQAELGSDPGTAAGSSV